MGVLHGSYPRHTGQLAREDQEIEERGRWAPLCHSLTLGQLSAAFWSSRASSCERRISSAFSLYQSTPFVIRRVLGIHPHTRRYSASAPRRRAAASTFPDTIVPITPTSIRVCRSPAQVEETSCCSAPRGERRPARRDTSADDRRDRAR